MKKNEVVPFKLGQKKSQVSNKNYRDPKNWPSSLQDFITRCFTKSNELNFNKELKDQFQLQLKKIIDKAIDENKMEINDWSLQKLPIFDYSFKKLELMCDIDPSSSTRQKRSGVLLPPQSSLQNPLKNGKISMKIPKLKSGVLKPSVFMPPSTTSLESSPLLTTTNIKRSIDTPPSAKDLKKQRLQRFLNESSSFVRDTSSSPAPLEQINNNIPLIGTCRNLEKNYLRLTSEPIPELVRPLSVLKKTLKLLRLKYEKEKDYNYLKNQLKSLRQDITVQHIKNRFTVKLYEFHSKIAIEFKDLGEFNQCQSQLKQLYQMSFNNNCRHKNKFEFFSYRILYFIITRDSVEIMRLKLSLMKKEPELINNEFIMLALKLWDYTLTNNYHDFFQLLRNLIDIDKTTVDKGEVNDEDDEVSMNNLNHSKFHYFIKMIKDFIVDKQLLTTFSILSKSYKKLNINFIQEELFAGSRTQLLEFLSEKQLTEFVEGDFFELSKAKQSIYNLTIGSRKIDIKGQI